MRSPTAPSSVLTFAGTSQEVPSGSAAVPCLATPQSIGQMPLIELARALGRQAAAELWAAHVGPNTHKDT